MDRFFFFWVILLFFFNLGYCSLFLCFAPPLSPIFALVDNYNQLSLSWIPCRLIWTFLHVNRPCTPTKISQPSLISQFTTYALSRFKTNIYELKMDLTSYLTTSILCIYNSLYYVRRNWPHQHPSQLGTLTVNESFFLPRTCDEKNLRLCHRDLVDSGREQTVPKYSVGVLPISALRSRPTARSANTASCKCSNFLWVLPLLLVFP